MFFHFEFPRKWKITGLVQHEGEQIITIILGEAFEGVSLGLPVYYYFFVVAISHLEKIKSFLLPPYKC